MDEFNLNPNQERAVNYDGLRPLLIEAGAGSGKTRVMTERVKFLLNNGANPESILVCTFSNKAANELKSRLTDEASKENSNISIEDVNKMQISTIHMFCINLLEEKGYKYTLLDDDNNDKRDLFIYKHKETLGFTNENYITRGQVNVIGDKFDEYIDFNVDLDNLIEYIKEEYPIGENYLELISSCDKFPYDEIYADRERKGDLNQGYYDSWYNSKFLQVAKAFPIYKKLLEYEQVADFSYIIYKTLEVLKEDNKSRFKHILVDEFQDVDYIQIQIFEILLKEALKNNSPSNIEGTFTAVGDMNQSIYGFRGAYGNSFGKFRNNYDCEVILLDINYRSSNEIVSLSENFISKYQSKCSNLAVKPSRDVSRDSYFMLNYDSESEADNISLLIENLVSSGKAKYDDFLILFRSVKHHGKELVESFRDNNIPYSIREDRTLMDCDEIKSFFTILNFIVNTPPSYNKLVVNNNDSSVEGSLDFSVSDLDSFSTSNSVLDELDEVYIPKSNRIEWLDLTAFTGKNFNQKMCNLSSETCEIINKIQENYELEVLEKGKEVQKLLKLKSRKRSFTGMLKHEKPVLKEIFKDIEVPFLSRELLEKNGVTNEDDLQFFDKLCDLRDDILGKSFDERDNILVTYYKILEVCGYLDEDFIKNEDNKTEVKNIALLSDKISNYQKIMSPNDIYGLYWYLSSNLDKFSGYSDESYGVNIMTIHQAKGLEYPITILASIANDKFPKIFDDPLTNKHRGKNPFYAPNDVFNDKNPQDSLADDHYKEEVRNIYVGLTRAIDTLILSIIPNDKGKMPIRIIDSIKVPEIIADLILDNPSLIKNLSPDNFDSIETLEYIKEENKLSSNSSESSDDSIESGELSKCADEAEESTNEYELKLSYSSMTKYSECPFAYNLLYNFNFRVGASNLGMVYGSIIHESLEEINKIIIENGGIYSEDFLSKEDIILIISNIFDSFHEIPINPFKKQEIIENILYYCNNYANKIKIIDSEYEFEINKGSHILNGAIDVIYECEDGTVGIIDYKSNTILNEKVINKYSKQIYTYILALKEDPLFANKEVSKAWIYGIKTNKEYGINLNEEEIVNVQEFIDETSKNIKSESFDETKKSASCNYCQFKFICFKS